LGQREGFIGEFQVYQDREDGLWLPGIDKVAIHQHRLAAKTGQQVRGSLAGQVAGYSRFAVEELLGAADAQEG